MSAAHSNTQQSFSHSRGGKFSRGGNTHSSSLDEAPEFKILRTKYSNGLKTLNEMFPDWTDADLLSALKEADGNLEITIARIAEGHTTQWGEVKSRKEKRQANKQHEEIKHSEKSSYVPRPASFRGGVRGGAARGGRGGYSGAASSTRSAKPASAASKPSAGAASSDAASGWDVERKSDSKSSAGAWGAKSSANAEESKPKETAPQAAPSSTAAPAKPAPMSWASIAKRGVKQASPEPAPASQSDKKPTDSAPTQDDETKSKQDSTVVTSNQENPEADSLETNGAEPAAEDNVETVVIEETITVVEVEKVKEEPAQPEDTTPATLEAEAETAALETAVPESQTAPVSAKKPATNARRLNQDAPVVMPTGSSSLERIGMQFGSLSIGSVELSSLAPAAAVASELEKPAAAAEATAAPVQPETKDAAVLAQAVPEAVSAVPAAAPAAAAPAAAPVAPASAAEPAAQASSAPQGPLTTYLQQQQQNISNQNPVYPSVSAISQMPLPNDYGAAALYGAEPPRNLMGFYDSYGYGQFVANKDASAAASSAESQTAATSGSQAAGINGANNLGQAGLFPQQMPQPFGMNHGMPWPQSYYFGMMQPGSQFHNPAAYGNNPALAAAYGQPFMKQQGMYMMYPGATPQGLQGAGSQQQQQVHQQQQQQQQQSVQQPGQQAAQGQQQAGQQAGAGSQQVNAQQTGVKNPAQSSAGNPYGNINAQKAGNPYGHYAANIGAGFGVYEQDPAALSNSPQQFSLGGMPGIFSASKGGAKDPNAKGNPPSGTAPVIGGTTYYSTPQQLGGYPSQVSSSHPQGFGSHHQQPYYASYAPSYGQTQTPHMYQQQQQQPQHHHHHQQQHQQPQGGHQQANKQYWEKQ
ncbi:RNAPII degradation factor [Coemansia sp. RSA 1722]|nr:RNAPII degradation factor [Coemansia sp. RSA 1722]